jgi:hypothetical protein
MPKPELKMLFCRRFDCAPDEFEERAFWKCLPWHARLVAPVVRRLDPDFFDKDFKFIRYLGMATGGREVQAEILSFQDVNRAQPNWLRTGLRIRVSGRKGAALAERLFFEAYRQGDLNR